MTASYLQTRTGILLPGSCLDRLPDLDDASIDAVVTDPPYELGLNGLSWDSSGIAFDQRVWVECLRVLKPGGHLLAFSGSRTVHRMAVAIEDAGFAIRDTIHWTYKQGYPRSMNVGLAMDKLEGKMRTDRVVETGTKVSASLSGPAHMVKNAGKPVTANAKKWDGFGTNLKPSHEPIVLARKDLDGTVALNVLAHGTGALNIGANKVTGRHPANTILSHDCDDVCEPDCPVHILQDGDDPVFLHAGWGEQDWPNVLYHRKPTPQEKYLGVPPGSVEHATVKPVSLMRHLLRLSCPPGGVVLDPFMGSGTTAVAAVLEGMAWVGCELTEDYLPIIEGRVKHAEGVTSNGGA